VLCKEVKYFAIIQEGKRGKRKVYREAVSVTQNAHKHKKSDKPK
jgi:hypothetical protein